MAAEFSKVETKRPDERVEESIDEKVDWFVRSVENLSNDLNRLRQESQGLKSRLITTIDVANLTGAHRKLLQSFQDRINTAKRAVQEEAEHRRQGISNEILKLLTLEMSTSTIQRLVHLYRRQNNLIDFTQTFLQLRQNHIGNVIEKRLFGKYSNLSYKEKLGIIFSIMEEQVLSTILQYQVMFSDLMPLVRFVLRNIDWLLGAIREMIKPIRTTIILHDWWDRLVKLDACFAEYEASFLVFAEPIFVNQAMTILSNAALVSLNSIKSKSTEQLLQKKNPALVLPPEASAHPPLIHIFILLNDLLKLVANLPLTLAISESRPILLSQCQEYGSVLAEKFPNQPETIKAFNQTAPLFINNALDQLNLSNPK